MRAPKKADILEEFCAVYQYHQTQKETAETWLKAKIQCWLSIDQSGRNVATSCFPHYHPPLYPHVAHNGLFLIQQNFKFY